MARRKQKKYYGYQREIPQNLDIVEIEKVVNVSPFGEEFKEVRFIIVDLDTGEIFDDAQGYGYKSIQKAKAALRYKSQSKDKFDNIYREEELVKDWCSKHKSLVRLIGEMRFIFVKDGMGFTINDMTNLLIENGINVDELPFSVNVLYKYL